MAEELTIQNVRQRLNSALDAAGAEEMRLDPMNGLLSISRVKESGNIYVDRLRISEDNHMYNSFAGHDYELSPDAIRQNLKSISDALIKHQKEILKVRS
jgi:hypothetical protein